MALFRAAGLCLTGGAATIEPLKGKPKKGPREKNITARFLSGGMDEDRVEKNQRFSDRSKNQQRDKTARTSQMRAEETLDLSDLQSLPTGEVIQVYSQYCDVVHGSTTWRCGMRKTLTGVLKGDLVVGDQVRFRDMQAMDEGGLPRAMIEQVLPRQTVLTRADSFKQIVSHPIVANAEQMLIVTSIAEPRVKWGIVDRMIVAAQAGGLVPIVCLNKVDLIDAQRAAEESDDQNPGPMQVLEYYGKLNIQTLTTSAEQRIGLDALRAMLASRATAVAGQSGVGKSSLIRSIEPALDLRVGAISGYTGKGRHTTTSARRYELTGGGQIIDTPGVKLFGLWNVNRDNLAEHFPDVAAETAPQWRVESYRRIEQSLSS